MFDNQGPVHATNVLRDFYAEHNHTFGEAFKEKLKVATRELSPVDAVVKGMETLYAASREDQVEGPDVLNALGVAATAVANGQFHGKGQRAWDIAAWAAHQIDPVDGLTPPEPEVDADYTFAEPITPAEPA